MKICVTNLPASRVIDTGKGTEQQRLFGLATERLDAIEDIAEKARTDALEQFLALYQSRLGSEPDEVLWLMVEELTDALTLIIGGRVDAVPNLTIRGERLAGGIRWHQEGCADIVIEAYDPAVRQRFSLAHELGHFYLHERQILEEQGGTHGDPHRMGDEADRVSDVDEEIGDFGDIPAENDGVALENPEWEIEADAFAGAFLVPVRRLKRDIQRFGKAVPFLAARYAVSPTSMRRRMMTLEALRELTSSIDLLNRADSISTDSHSENRHDMERASVPEVST